MGKELEYKLAVADEPLLLQILRDPDIAALQEGEIQTTAMKTDYYDSPDRRFSARKWTFRRRLEGNTSIVCVKTPTGERHTRGEWQIEAQAPDAQAVCRLVAAGAPKELLYLYGAGDVAPVCGAAFQRRHVMLRFSDGSRAELAGDCGELFGAHERLSFTELELELYEGTPEQMLALVRLLCERYRLHEQLRSKVARARALK